jgi:hypothetical protein
VTRRQEAVAAVEGRCPRCGAARERTQEYCVECGLRLPTLRGSIPALRRRWVRRLGWYPGDWVWVSLLTLLVAAAGAAAAIAFGGGTSSAAATTAVAPTPRRISTVPAAPLPTAPEPGVSTRTKTTSTTTATRPAPANGRLPWPAGRNGWTIVLFSYPVTSGTAAASSTAARAAHAGLPEVGVIDSGQFSSLHPGYYVVFSGVYSSKNEAEAALRSVRASGFSSAYTRQISR